jgi:3-oxoacyl-[acyl-carrier protein] reductase
LLREFDSTVYQTAMAESSGGTIKTPMVTAIGGLDEDNMSSVFARVPLNRMGAADEAAKAFAFLLSDESSYMTGSTVVVEGGLLC